MAMNVTTLRALYIVMLIFLSVLQTRGVLWLCPDPAWVVGVYAFFTMLFAFENLVLLEDLKQLRDSNKGIERCASVSVVNEILYQNFMLNLEKMSLEHARTQFNTWRSALPRSKKAALIKHGQSCPQLKNVLAHGASMPDMTHL